MTSLPMNSEKRLLYIALGLAIAAVSVRALAMTGAFTSSPCKEERGDKGCPTVPPPRASEPEILPTKVRPFPFSESSMLDFDTDPNNAETIICICAICESNWLDRSFVRSGSDATQVSPAIIPIQCRSNQTIRGYLIGSLAGKEILTVENADRRTALRWFDVDRKKVRKEQKATQKDDFLGGGNIFSDAGDGVIAGESVLFTNTAGALRSYPSRTDLPGRAISGIYSPEIGLGVLNIGEIKYAANSSADGVVYRRFIPTADQNLEPQPLNVRRIWASQRWILRNFAQDPAIWVLSQADGKNEQFLAYGGIGACGQPLMGDYALNLEVGNEYSVMALSLLPKVPDYRIRGIPLDRLYCVGGDEGVIAVTGRYDKHPAVAVYQSGAWQRILLPDSPSVLEPVVQDGRILVSAPEEKAPGKIDGAPIPSVGAVYVLGKDASTWSIRERIVPATPRQHAIFGYKVLLLGKRLFINYLDDYPKAKGMPREGFGYPSVCEMTLL